MEGRSPPPPPARPLPPDTIDHEADPGLALVMILMVALVAATLGVFSWILIRRDQGFIIGLVVGIAMGIAVMYRFLKSHPEITRRINKIMS